MAVIRRVLVNATCAAGLLLAVAVPSTGETETYPEPVSEAEDSTYVFETAVASPDWGSPPADEWDAGEEWPPLPEAKGWARFQGMGWAFNWWEVLTVGNGVVVMHDYELDKGSVQLAAYDLTDGHVVWESKLPALDHYAPLVSSGDILIYSSGPQNTSGVAGIGALKLRSGKQLWTRPETLALAGGAAGVWVAHLTPGQATATNGGEPVLGELSLLEAQTGRQQQKFALGQLYGFATQIPADGKTMAVTTSDALFTLTAAGTKHKLAGKQPGWESRLAIDAAGVLEVTTPPIPEATDDLWKTEPGETPEESERKFLQTPYYKAISTGRARLYDLNGKALWQAEFKPMESYGAKVITPRLGAAAAVVVERQGLLIYERRTGADIRYPQLPRGESDYISAQLFGDTVIARVDNLGEGAAHPALAISLADGSAQPAPQALPDWNEAKYGAGYMAFTAAGHGMPSDDQSTPSCVATVCLPVNAQLEPQPGELKLLDPPETYVELRQRFLASADPAQDIELMRAVVTDGQRAVHQLYLVTGADRPQHLAALTLAAIYIEQHRQGYASATGLAIYDLRRYGAAIEPLLLEWQQDPRFGAIKQQLSNQILTAGGAGGSEFAVREFDLPDYAPLTVPAPPYTVEKRDSWKIGDEGKSYETMQWVEQTGDDGKRYAVFTGYGPIGGQDITLGIDEDNDDEFEVVVPTGINDLCCMQFLPGGSEVFSSGAAITLQVADGKLTIGHHIPRIEFNTEYQYYSLEGASYGASTLELADVRRDSDRDKLTDVTERLLLLDAQAADTDGDGTDDAHDATPNVNAAAMGKLERGVARALEYYYAGTDWDWSRPGFVPPYDAEFLQVQGAGPVAFALGGRRTVCISSPEQVRQYELAGGGLPLGSAVAATVGADDSWREVNNSGAAAPWGINLGFTGSGAFVELKEIDGEYYPVRKYETWIS